VGIKMKKFICDRLMSFSLMIFCWGLLIGALLNKGPDGFRLSGTAIGEIHFSPKCMGQERNWFVTKDYVYANCPGGPITVQNYEFK